MPVALQRDGILFPLDDPLREILLVFGFCRMPSVRGFIVVLRRFSGDNLRFRSPRHI